MTKLQMIKRSDGSLSFSSNIPLAIIKELGWRKSDKLLLEIKTIENNNFIMVSKVGGEYEGS